MQQRLNRRLGMRRIRSLKNLAKFGPHLLRLGALLPPALTPRFQHQRLTRVSVMIACHDQRRARFQASLDRLQDGVFLLVAIEVMEDADQGRCVE